MCGEILLQEGFGKKTEIHKHNSKILRLDYTFGPKNNRAGIKSAEKPPCYGS
jgi:hypothetical protein